MTEERRETDWDQRREVEWLQYSIQPPPGLLKGEYYLAEREFGMATWTPGHHGRLEVVKGEKGELLFVEFNEQCMDMYYCQYFSKMDKRRSDYGIWQASKERQRKLGIVLADGMRHVEKQILQRQSLAGEFELLTGASGSMRQMLPLAQQLAETLAAPSGKRYYSLAESFGYGLTGWLRVVAEKGSILSCQYDEVFADHQEEIWYPELKRYYKQSKCCSPCFEEPFPPGWNIHAWLIGFRDMMNILNQRVVETQNLLDIDGLPHVDGENLGPVWNRHSPWDKPIEPYVKGKPRPRHPAWDNYLALAEKLLAEMKKDGVL